MTNRQIPIVDKHSDPDTWSGNPILFARQVVTGFIQGLFGAVEGTYHWDEDKNKSRIFIAGSGPVKAEVFGQFPAIIVSRSGMQFANAGLGGMESANWRDGSIVRSDLINGLFVVQHLSRDEGEAENLAFYVAEMMWLHQEMLARYGFILSGGATVEQPGPAGSLVEGDSKGLTAVPVVLPYRCMRRSRIQPLGNPVLRAFRLRVSSLMTQFPPPIHPESAAPPDGDPARIGETRSRWERPPSQEAADVASSSRTAEPKE